MAIESNSLTFSAVFLNNNPLVNPKIDELARWGKKCKEEKLVLGTDGNLSFHSTLGFVISGTGIALDALAKETVAEVTGVVFGMAGTQLYVKGAVTPSRESLLHNALYEEDENAEAIFHLHDTVVMAKAAKLGIPVTETEYPAGSQELAKEAVKLLKSNKGVKYFVLKNHGIIALGATMDEAGQLAEEMRKKAEKS
jgi:ribulose-5-phosphate 4-epimerase/fuculose-1-phosphate aldolase